ncbi:UDP-glucuronic acid decarboxylase family protein [uncultured Methanobrevibacter sp.]|uniref:UDP-glucuronic acid decarboxylase family protein n=1 Tax=uncultured Methanobrevibacter sp. TaxID=253161 RepID=UPI0025EEA792|nr:UDP-glucuronic acid decarboxylase family protein [uncultured Methanobrevibacter sp.]
MKTILIAGGAGFIGTNLCKRFLNEGYKIICVDNFHTSNKRNLKKISSENFKLIEHDITKPFDIDEGIDEIYNLASPASPRHYQSNPLQTIKTNVHGVFNLLDLAVKYDAEFLQSSTSEIYGEPLEHPQKESYWGNVNPNGIRSSYDESKRCAESICLNYYNEYGVNVKICRIFNTYGPYMDPSDGRVVTNFIIQALKGEDLTIYGEGTQTRSFCHVDDLLDAFIKVMATETEFTGPINLGNPIEFTISDLANKVIEKIDSKSKIIYLPLPQDDPSKRKPDISFAREKLKWQPKITLDEGLDNTISYYDNLINSF